VGARLLDWIVDNPGLFFGSIVGSFVAYVVHGSIGGRRREAAIADLELAAPVSPREAKLALPALVREREARTPPCKAHKAAALLIVEGSEDAPERCRDAVVLRADTARADRKRES
jgi:hypothetical protein